MLSQAQVVAIKRAYEKMYDGRCSVVEKQKVKKADKSTGFQEVTVLVDQPCRLSFSSAKNADNADMATGVQQIIKLFIDPSIVIKPGSKVIVFQNGISTEYKNSGLPAIYPTHQEIVLELFERWT